MIDLIYEIRKLVRDAKVRSKSGRCHFSDEQKVKIKMFTKEVMNNGLTLSDAAQILNIQRSTLSGWMN